MPEKHVILVWTCKGKGCGQYHLAKYLGEKNKIEGRSFNFRTPGNAVIVTCQKCGGQHSYDRSEIRSMEMDSPPPHGYKEILSEFLVSSKLPSETN